MPEGRGCFRAGYIHTTRRPYIGGPRLGLTKIPPQSEATGRRGLSGYSSQLTLSLATHEERLYTFARGGYVEW